MTAERHFLHCLGGGCSAPVAAYAVALADDLDQVNLTALVGAPDGRCIIRVRGTGRPQVVAAALATEAMRQGAAQWLTPDLAARPLAGRRIVVTRAADQAAGLVTQLTELGAQPIIIPAIRIVPLPDLSQLDHAIAELAAYDWLIFTSANAVRILAERMHARGVAHTNLNQCAIAAVGPATADALRTLGVEATFVPETYVAEALAGGLGDVAHKRILLPQAAAARATLAEQLTAQGAQVDAIAIYTTEPAAIEEAQRAQLAQGVDAILFTSGSTARNFLTAVRQDASAQTQVERALLACIGPITAQVVAELGATVGVVAAEATTASLVQALVQYFAKESMV